MKATTLLEELAKELEKERQQIAKLPDRDEFQNMAKCAAQNRLQIKLAVLGRALEILKKGLSN